jgi:hypothetical protein
VYVADEALRVPSPATVMEVPSAFTPPRTEVVATGKVYELPADELIVKLLPLKDRVTLVPAVKVTVSPRLTSDVEPLAERVTVVFCKLEKI